ncbi:MAG: hypothetical protein R3B90_08710 [Planctomycetaceae bacterium]
MSVENAAPDSSTGSLHDFATFKWFITPVIIQVVFWLQVAAVAGWSIFQFVLGVTALFSGEGKSPCSRF